MYHDRYNTRFIRILSEKSSLQSALPRVITGSHTGTKVTASHVYTKWNRHPRISLSEVYQSVENHGARSLKSCLAHPALGSPTSVQVYALRAQHIVISPSRASEDHYKPVRSVTAFVIHNRSRRRLEQQRKCVSRLRSSFGKLRARRKKVWTGPCTCVQKAIEKLCARGLRDIGGCTGFKKRFDAKIGCCCRKCFGKTEGEARLTVLGCYYWYAMCLWQTMGQRYSNRSRNYIRLCYDLFHKLKTFCLHNLRSNN